MGFSALAYKRRGCNDTGFTYSAAVSRDLVWGGPARAQGRTSQGHQLRLVSSVPIKPAWTSRKS